MTPHDREVLCVVAAVLAVLGAIAAAGRRDAALALGLAAVACLSAASV